MGNVVTLRPAGLAPRVAPVVRGNSSIWQQPLKLPSVQANARISAKVEREVSFLIPYRSVQAVIQGELRVDFELRQISQAYFRRSYFPSLLRRLKREHGLDLGFDPAQIAQARLRHERVGFTEAFLVELKSRRDLKDCHARHEVSIPVDRAEFQNLSRKLKPGAVNKLRVIPASQRQVGLPIELEAHIDLILAAGPETKLGAPRIGALRPMVPFAVVDLEVNSLFGSKSLPHAELSSSQLSSSQLLSSSVSLMAQPRTIRRLFSMQTLAKLGAKEATLAARALLEL